MIERNLPTIELLARLKEAGVNLRLDGGTLRLDAPKGFLVGSLREELSVRKAEIVRVLQESARLIDQDVMPLRPVPREGALPLSFAQERLWFLSQLEPDSTAYTIHNSVRLREKFDENAMEQTLGELGRRHETLRTTFGLIDGRPMQTISPDPNLTLEKTDLRFLPPEERIGEAARLAEESSRMPLDLASGPLLRVRVYQLDDKDQVIHLSIHHIISDYWSLGVLWRELAELYRAFSTGKSAQLPDLGVQYADFAACQRKWLQGDVFDRHLAYWREKLGGELAALDLPTDRPRPMIQTHRGAEESLTLSRAHTAGLREFALRDGDSLFMVLLAAFKVLLFRYTAQEDIVLGTPIAGRSRLELEGLIGLFINTVVMRTDLSGNPTFKELLGRVRETALGAYAYQDMPFEKLVERLAPERDMGRTPLFQVFFNHIRAHEDGTGLSASHFEDPWGTGDTAGVENESKFDMTFYVWERPDSVRFTVLYNADLFDACRIATMLEQYKDLLEQIVEKPEERIGRYSLLTFSQRTVLPDPTQPLAERWPGAVHERFAERARNAPHRVALVCGTDTWTYGELERSSNHIAGHLRSKGIRPGDVVAVYAHRSIGLVPALLGILKARAAFLILDSRYPGSRLVKMLEQASPRGWLQMEAAGPIDEGVSEWIDTSGIACRLMVPGAKTGIEHLSGDALPGPDEDRTGPGDTAYVIFTSGTTDQPKGIVGPHGPLAHFLEWHSRKFGFDESERFSMLSGLSHDPLLRDIFTPLWLGATVCIPDPDEMLVPDKLRDWMGSEAITVSHMTPALGRILSEATRGGETGAEVPALRHVFFGGDVLMRRDVERIGKTAPHARCVNYYGTSETPQGIGYHVVDTGAGDHLPGEEIPLGKGIEGVQLLVLNKAGRLAGIGELGEICVRTPYLTSGYLGDEAMTRDRFIQNPFGGTERDRLYRTGDLGRYLPDGSVMFHGRPDSQVSIRGFRVELKEIETILASHLDIRDCAVLTQERGSGERSIVAYVVAGGPGSVVAAKDLRSFLRGSLPDYMIPSSFIQVDEIPLTPNGKVDARQLSRLKPSPVSVDIADDEPLTEMEQLLADTWKEVLSIDSVSVHDNFYEIGGHSLLSIQVISRLERKIGLKVNPREFIYQTLGQMATSIERQKPEAIPLIPEEPRKGGFWHRIRGGRKAAGKEP